MTCMIFAINLKLCSTNTLICHLKFIFRWRLTKNTTLLRSWCFYSSNSFNIRNCSASVRRISSSTSESSCISAGNFLQRQVFLLCLCLNSLSLCTFVKEKRKKQALFLYLIFILNRSLVMSKQVSGKAFRHTRKLLLCCWRFRAFEHFYTATCVKCTT